MTESLVLSLIDGVRVVVPNSLDLITPYVLREQLDFFEDELAFVRQLLRPGQQVIDIGANYGVYTLPMAAKLGPGGHLWAFEPTSSTAEFLAKGISENAFGQVTLVRSAVSSAPGSAQISLQYHSELNSLIHGQPPPGKSETVSVVSLDECKDRYGWREIELIKIDAEGEESNIIKGGRRFFAELAPLVQYELRTALEINFELIREFEGIGYDSYRLVPGLNILVPFEIGEPADPYLLNLYCCKRERADQLAARGLLLRRLDLGSRPIASDASYHWSQTLVSFPYASQLLPAWREAESKGNISELIQALSHYSRSRDGALSPSARFLCLRASYLMLKAECEREPARLRLASLARAAHDYGERAVSVAALKQLLDHIRVAGVDPNEPFLAPLERFDSIPLGAEPAPWLVAAVLEQLERRERFSSFYADPSALERLEDIQSLGHGSPEMKRRLDLVRQRIERTYQRGRE
jgi:FkbM family methyltransferase